MRIRVIKHKINRIYNLRRKLKKIGSCLSNTKLINKRNIIAKKNRR